MGEGHANWWVRGRVSILSWCGSFQPWEMQLGGSLDAVLIYMQSVCLPHMGELKNLQLVLRAPPESNYQFTM